MWHICTACFSYNNTGKTILSSPSPLGRQQPDSGSDSNGEPIPIINGISRSRLIDGESCPSLGTPRRLAEQLIDLTEATDFTPRTQTEKDIIAIVLEEAAFFYDESKTAEETAAVIQRRAELLIKERDL